MRTIKLHGTEYPILFDLNAVEAIQEHFGGDIAKMAENMRDIKTVRWLLALIINEGQRLQAYEYNIPAKPLTEDDVGMLMTAEDMSSPELIDSIVDAFNEGLGTEKNLTAGQLQTIGETILNRKSTSPG